MYGNSSVLAWISWPKNVSYVWRYGGVYRENMNELMNVVNWAVPRSRSATITIITFYTDTNQLLNPRTIICSKFENPVTKAVVSGNSIEIVSFLLPRKPEIFSESNFFQLTVRMSTSGKNTSPDTCFWNKCTENIVCIPLHKLQEVENTDKIIQFQVCGNKGCKSNLESLKDPLLQTYAYLHILGIMAHLINLLNWSI